MAQDTNAVNSGGLPPEETLSLEQQLLLPREEIELQTDQLLPITGTRLPPRYDDVSRDDDNAPSIGQFIC